ncbi:hypothetical protein [Prescottella equi]|uniref:hypothetical protein n=1 Tax=Rhodococcus hoagii TaxID=43767 RepID=UPI00384FA56B
MTDLSPKQANGAAAEPLRLRVIGVATLVILVALAVAGYPDRRWPAAAGVLVLGAVSGGIVAWRGRRTDRAETRAAMAVELIAVAALFGAFTLAMWSHDAWKLPLLIGGIHPL